VAARAPLRVLQPSHVAAAPVVVGAGDVDEDDGIVFV